MAFSDTVSLLRRKLPGTPIKYTPVPTSRSRSHSHEQPERSYSERHRKFAKMFMGGTFLLVILFMTLRYGYVDCVPKEVILMRPDRQDQEEDARPRGTAQKYHRTPGASTRPSFQSLQI